MTIDSDSFNLVGTPRSSTDFIVHVGSISIQVFSFLVNLYCKKCNLQGNKDDFDFIIPLDKDIHASHFNSLSRSIRQDVQNR